MAVNLTTPYGEGFAAFLSGKHIGLNPYYVTADFVKASEWDDGWMRSYNEHFGRL